MHVLLQYIVPLHDCVLICFTACNTYINYIQIMINLAYKFRDNTKIKNLNAMYLSKLSHRLREARMVSCLIRLTYS